MATTCTTPWGPTTTTSSACSTSTPPSGASPSRQPPVVTRESLQPPSAQAALLPALGRGRTRAGPPARRRPERTHLGHGPARPGVRAGPGPRPARRTGTPTGDPTATTGRGATPRRWPPCWRPQAPPRPCLVGMSNGGASAIRLAAHTPGPVPAGSCSSTSHQRSTSGAWQLAPPPHRGVTPSSLAMGPPLFDSFDEMAEPRWPRARAARPTGVRSACATTPAGWTDGRWTLALRQLPHRDRPVGGPRPASPRGSTSAAVGGRGRAHRCPALLVRGAESPYRATTRT